MSEAARDFLRRVGTDIQCALFEAEPDGESLRSRFTGKLPGLFDGSASCNIVSRKPAGLAIT